VRHQLVLAVLAAVAAAAAVLALVGGSVVADPLAPNRRLAREVAVVDEPLPTTTERPCPVAGHPARLACRVERGGVPATS
jgi:hypothetical protein